MVIRKVKKLIEMLEESSLAEIEINEGEESIRISRASSVTPAAPVAVAAAPPAAPAPAAAPATVGASAESAAEPAGGEIPAGHAVKSPMVGTFYTTPSPNAEPFVEVGSKVDNDTVIGILEAMKVMNEIKSDLNGTVKKVLASNGVAVEYGQPLFLVEPD